MRVTLCTYGRYLIVLPFLLVSLSCELLGPEVEEPGRFDIIVPTRVGTDGIVPAIVLRTGPEPDSLDRAYRGEVLLVDADASVAPGTVRVRHGVGSHTFFLNGPQSLVVTVAGERSRKTVSHRADQPVQEVSGTLQGAVVTWDGAADIRIDGDVVVPAGTRLEVAEDTRVLLGPAANLIVRGTLVVTGSRERPVLFASASADEPWGGIVVQRGTMDARYAFFVNGGADDRRIHGHSNSQPVIHFEHAIGHLRRVFIMDSPGKGLGGANAEINFEHGLITRCDTGGEVHFSRTRIAHSHILEIPNANAEEVDDDNDGFYFFDALPGASEPSRVEHSFIIDGKDDAIDHNQAKLEIHSSLLEGFANECVAGSSANFVHVVNSILTRCEQGVEAGYGAPSVRVDHSVITGNAVGVRYGDSYTNPLQGHITVTNSLVFGNTDNVLNLDRATGAAVPGAIDFAYSVTNDPEYLDCPGCLQANPDLDDRFMLKPGSPGKRAGATGEDLGLLDPLW